MNKRWASEGECVEALGLSHTVLTRLRASGDLVAGDHWIWIGGQRNGKVGYDLDRIETWQRERTAQIVRPSQVVPMEKGVETTCGNWTLSWSSPSPISSWVR